MICLIAEPALSAENTFDGDYTGKRTLVKGSGEQCPAEEDVSVTIHGEVLTFTNSKFTKFPLIFQPHEDGSFGEIWFGGGENEVNIRGRVIGDVMDADATSYWYDPPCEYHWHLKKVH